MIRRPRRYMIPEHTQMRESNTRRHRLILKLLPPLPQVPLPLLDHPGVIVKGMTATVGTTVDAVRTFHWVFLDIFVLSDPIHRNMHLRRFSFFYSSLDCLAFLVQNCLDSRPIMETDHNYGHLKVLPDFPELPICTHSRIRD